MNPQTSRNAMREQADRSCFDQHRGFGLAALLIALAWIVLPAVSLQRLARADQQAAQEQGQRAQRPNVLFLISDQHNAKFLGCGGIVPVKTPNLDRLAREGVRFTNAVTNSAICTPSRMSYFSGQYVHNHGYYGLSGPNPGGLPTVLGHFRRAGYKTAAIGKIHCPLGWIEKDSDIYREVYERITVDRRSPYDDYLRRLGLKELRDDDFLQEQGPAPTGQHVEARPSRLPYKHSVEGWCVQEATKFIESCGKQPWIMQVSLPRPHQIFTPSQNFWDLYPDNKIWLPPNTNADLSNKAPHLKQVRLSYNNPAGMFFEPKNYEALKNRRQHGYISCVTQVDHAVGELLDFLDRKGLAKNTIVIYTSDHGDFGCEFGLLEKVPGICADAVCRIPSIWRWPGHIQAGQVCDRIVQPVDVAPTFCALAGLPSMPTADGEDITPLLHGEDREIHKIGVTEHPWSKAVLKGHWRLVYYPKGYFGEKQNDFGELYNLDDDPWEMKNLYFDPRYRNKVAELKNDLLDWGVTTTRVKTVLPPIAPRGDPLPPDANPVFFHQQEADGKLSWRDVEAMQYLHYK